VSIDRPNLGDDPGEAKADRPTRHDRIIPDLDSMSTEALESAFGSKDDQPRGWTVDEMPVKDDGEAAVESAGYRAWYRDHGADDPKAPAPFDRAPMREVQEAEPRGWGAGIPTYGILTEPADRVLKDAERVWVEPQRSGRKGPAASIDWAALGVDPRNMAVEQHVESHAAATMRERGMDEGVLYLTRPTCPNDGKLRQDQRPEDVPTSCHYLLENGLLPPGAKLTVYGPDGFRYVYRGKTEGEG